MSRKWFVVLAFVLGLTGGVVLARTTTNFYGRTCWSLRGGRHCLGCGERHHPGVRHGSVLPRRHGDTGADRDVPLPLPPTRARAIPNHYSTTYTLRPGQYAPTTGETAQTSLAKMEHIDIAPANCDGWLAGGAYFDKMPPTMFWRRGDTVGYLSYGTHTTVDYVVSPYEAWCSGVREKTFTLDAYNTRPVVGSVDESKAYFDPLEWWNRDDPASPRNTNYPGWCEYLHMHVDVKYRYQATMDQAEYDFVQDQLGMC